MSIPFENIFEKCNSQASPDTNQQNLHRFLPFLYLYYNISEKECQYFCKNFFS